MFDNNGRRRFLLGSALGCQTMPGTRYGPVGSRENMAGIIRTAVDQGVTFFDTAEGERLPAPVLAGTRVEAPMPR